MIKYVPESRRSVGVQGRLYNTLLSRRGHQTVGSRTAPSPLVWAPQEREVGAKVGMGPQPIMGHCAVAQQGDPHVDDVVGEIAAVREPLGARVVIGQEVREQTPREGGRPVPGVARVL